MEEPAEDSVNAAVALFLGGPVAVLSQSPFSA